jgi:hypothetical protein
MPRPKKASPDNSAATDEMDTVPETFALKPCPKCGTEARQPYIAKNGYWRCHCSHPQCSRLDCLSSLTAKDAAKRWNEAGGPDRPND